VRRAEQTVRVALGARGKHMLPQQVVIHIRLHGRAVIGSPRSA
jgi:hypothetical protein